MSDTRDFVSQYRQVWGKYDQFRQRIAALIEELLLANQIRYQIVESRTKTIDSFAEKISRPNKSYSDPLNEITDISGVRVLVYYNDDVERVGEILTSEFQVIEKELSHQPHQLEADRFGYISAHYIVKLSKNRTCLNEWNAYADLHAEVQIRTVLQHAWAAISHALQYKRESDVPPQLQRQLFRMAGLLELADEEFIKIRDSHMAIVDDTRLALRRGEKEILISPTSIIEFISTSKRLKELGTFAESCGFSYDEDDEDDIDEFVGEIERYTSKIGIHTIGELEKILDSDFSDYLRQLVIEDVDPSGRWIISSDFLLLLLLVRAGIEKFSVEMLVNEEDWSREIAERVIDTAKSDAGI